MARATTPDLYQHLIAEARNAICEPAITTDLIVGFPGETMDEFAESLAFVEQMKFSGGHVFVYSERPGTIAATLSNSVAYPIRRQRSAKMRTLLENSTREYRSHYIGTTQQVLWESSIRSDPNRWELHGLTDRYIPVSANSTESRHNCLDRVSLELLSDNGIFGCITEKEE
jgi:threonylcarbamoyladenosine tRNA methylthiotransferase MtaB